MAERASVGLRSSTRIANRPRTSALVRARGAITAEGGLRGLARTPTLVDCAQSSGRPR